MMPTRNRASVLCGAVMTVAALALGGCSSSTTGGGTTAAASTTARVAQTTAAAPLKKLDPLDFVYTKSTETASYTETSAASPYTDMTDPEVSPFTLLATCLGTKPELPTAAADGAALSLNDGETTVNSNVEIVSPAQRARDDKTLRDPRFAPCLEQKYIDDVKGGGEPNDTVHWGDSKLVNVRVPAGASGHVMINLPILGNATNQQLETMVIDIVFLSSGQVESQFAVTSLSSPAEDVVTAGTAQLAAKLKQQ